MQAYEANEAREYFTDSAELHELQAVIAKTMHGLRQKGIWCIAKDYCLDLPFDVNEINKKLSFVNTDDARRKFEINDLDPSNYPVQHASTNYISYLQDEMMLERKVYVQSYYDQGFLGRVLIYCIDKLIQGCTASFELIKQERQILTYSQTMTESSIDSGSSRRTSIYPAEVTVVAPSVTRVAVHDLDRIELMKRIRMLRSVLKDCKQVRKEADRVNSYLDTKRTSDVTGSGIVSKVKSLIEQPSDVAAFSKHKQVDIQDLIAFDINKLKGGSMAFQKEMDAERDKQQVKIQQMTDRFKTLEK